MHLLFSRLPRSPRFHATAALAIVTLVAGCRGVEPPDAEATAPRATAPDASAQHASAHKQRVTMLWAQHCALCHVNGEGGAPRLGDAVEWQARVAQGQTVLLRHTIEGFNKMLNGHLRHLFGIPPSAGRQV